MLKAVLISFRAKAKSDFARALAILVGGTAGAQALTMAAMPLLSRLYGPADFGGLAVFVGIVTTIAVSACLRFDVAVALPESEVEAAVLLRLAMLCAIATSILAYLILLMLPDFVAQWLKLQSLGVANWLIPFGLLACALVSMLQNWHIRKGAFAVISKGRFMQAVAAIGTQGSLGLLGAGALGLVAGNVLGFCASILFMGYGSAKKIFATVDEWRWQVLWPVARRYARFPLYSTWEAMANQAAIHAPIILIASTSKAEEAGYLMLAMSIMQAPMSLFGAAIGQVYLSQAVEKHRKGRLLPFTQKIISNLLRAGGLPIIGVALASPFIFPYMFGQAWVRAGWLVTWMAPWFLLQFLVSPVSMGLHIVGAQRAAMLMQFFVFAIRLGLTWVATRWLPTWTAEAYAVSGALVYGLYLIVVLNRIGKMHSIKIPAVVTHNER